MNAKWDETSSFAERWFSDTESKLFAMECPSVHEPETTSFRNLAVTQIVKLKEYVVLALLAFKRGLYFPGLSLLRVVYESAIWLQWCIDLKGHVEERILVWRRYSFEEKRKYLEDVSQAIPQAKADLQKCLQILEENFRNVAKCQFNDVFNSLFKNMKKGRKDQEARDDEIEKMRREAYSIYRELCSYAHAHPNLEEYVSEEGEVGLSEMPLRTPYYLAVVLVHIVSPIRRFLGFGNDDMIKEFLDLTKKGHGPVVEGSD